MVCGTSPRLQESNPFVTPSEYFSNELVTDERSGRDDWLEVAETRIRLLSVNDRRVADGRCHEKMARNLIGQLQAGSETFDLH